MGTPEHCDRRQLPGLRTLVAGSWYLATHESLLEEVVLRFFDRVHDVDEGHAMLGSYGDAHLELGRGVDGGSNDDGTVQGA